jgi:ABC-type multidrug transport system ATPase subunit
MPRPGARLFRQSLFFIPWPKVLLLSGNVHQPFAKPPSIKGKAINPVWSMNEQVLHAILRLLAIISKIEGPERDEFGIVEKFLSEHLNDVLVRYYLDVYEQYVLEAVVDEKETRKICQKINREMTLRQKVFILLHLLEIVLANQTFTEQEKAFILIIVKALNIEEVQYNRVRAFLMKEFSQVESENLLIINGFPHRKSRHGKHMFRQGAKAGIAVLRMPKIDTFFVRALGSREDFFLNGDLVRQGYTYPISPGSVLKGEKINPIYFSEIVSNFIGADAPAKISFEAIHIDYHFKTGDKGLHQVSLAEESGNLVAIMGASGSGKTTLVNVLNGILTPTKGKVLINGLDVHRQKEEIKGVIGYIPQDDLLIEELTVFENLYYAARFCYAHSTPTELDFLVNQTLERLGLAEIKELRVGNVLDKTISGGQRKRLNIGLELIRQPSVLFVDEPTSGLSSRDSENIMDLLYELTRAGKLIFVIIHQPPSDIFKLFDKLVLLDIGGYQIYYGNPIEAVSYFKTLANQTNKDEGACATCGNVNSEQIFNIVEAKVLDDYGKPTNIRKTSPRKWHRQFQQSIRVPKIERIKDPPPKALDIPGRLKQFEVFLDRNILSKLSNRQYLFVNLLQAPLLALILAFIVRFYLVDEAEGPVTYQLIDNINLPAYIFMSIIVALFIGLTSSAEEIIRDGKILKREEFLSLSHTSYLLSKVCVLFVISALQVAMYVAIGHYILAIKGLELPYWFMLFSCACFANMLGLNISSAFKHAATVYNLIPIILIPQLVLGGIVVKFDEVNPFFSNRNGYVPWIGEIMASRWAFEALAVVQFRENAFDKQFFALDRERAQAEYRRVYYLPTLLTKAETCHELFRDSTRQDDFSRNFLVLSNELAHLQRAYPDIAAPVLPTNPPRFTWEIMQEVRWYIDTLAQRYNQQHRMASRQKDRLIEVLIQEKGRAAYLAMMNDYRNQAITDLVSNAKSEKRIIEYKGQLIQKIYPVYLEPTPSFFTLRAHFFAYVKYLMGYPVSVFWFNALVLWLMTLFLYVALYFEGLKKVVQFFQEKPYPRARSGKGPFAQLWTGLTKPIEKRN